MKKIYFILILILSTDLILPQDSFNIPDYFYKRLEGKINDKPDIQMNLTRTVIISMKIQANLFTSSITAISGRTTVFTLKKKAGTMKNIIQ